MSERLRRSSGRMACVPLPWLAACTVQIGALYRALLCLEGRVYAPTRVGNTSKRLDSLLQLDRRQRVRLEQRMDRHVIVEQQMLGVRVAHKGHAEHLGGFTLVPVGANPERRD